jgi:hypothetical protein
LIFRRIQEGKGFHLKNLKDSGRAGIISGKRIVYIKRVYEKSDEERTINHIQNAYADTVLNEIMHQAAGGVGLYSDRDLAKALFSIMTASEKAANPLPRTGDAEKNGRYFHSFFSGRCPAPESR